MKTFCRLIRSFLCTILFIWAESLSWSNTKEKLFKLKKVRVQLNFYVFILLLAWLCPSHTAFANQQPATSQRSIIIMGGDQNYPPSTFTKDSRPAEFQVDVLKTVAAAKRSLGETSGWWNWRSGLKLSVVIVITRINVREDEEHYSSLTETEGKIAKVPEG